jgi:hypothetical protein
MDERSTTFVSDDGESPLLELTQAAPGRLLVLCEGKKGRGFYICPICGAGFRERSNPRGHQNRMDRLCNGSLANVSLGHDSVYGRRLMPDLARGDRVIHATFGEGAVEAVRGEVATVRFAQGKPKSILASHLERQLREGPPPRAADAGTLFDAYLMVDWSAGSKPKTGPDSVWYCLLEPAEGRLFTTNPSTREEACEEIRGQLVNLVSRGRRVLIGFDFPYGFPRGTGARLGFSGGPAWRVMWDELSLLVEDGADNQSNRFGVAADMNGGMTTGPAPFWGCPPSQSGPLLHPKKPQPWPKDIPELRWADQAVAGPKSIWQLYGAGSVGSQALVGIPRLAALLDDPALHSVSHVWPFEITRAALAV